MPSNEPPSQAGTSDVILEWGDRTYLVRGLEGSSDAALRVNLRCSRNGQSHVDRIELYSARQRMTFACQAGKKLGIEEATLDQDLDQLVIKLEALRLETG